MPNMRPKILLQDLNGQTIQSIVPEVFGTCVRVDQLNVSYPSKVPNQKSEPRTVRTKNPFVQPY